MSNFKIIVMTQENINDINIPNQPFEVCGKIEPSFNNGKWTFKETIIHNSYEYKFPDDEIDYSEYIDNPDKVVFFVYDNLLCMGQIRIRRNWNGFCFIEDIAVAKAYRNQGVAGFLLKEAEAWAKNCKIKGFMLEAQDFNLTACRFYYKKGFVLGSVDNMLYYNTENNDVLALFWYKIFEN